MQAALDTTLARAGEDIQHRFRPILEAAEPNESGSFPRVQADLKLLAQRKIVDARRALGLTPAEFGEALSSALGWTPTADTIRSWETTVVPPGDVILATNLATRNVAQKTQSLGQEYDRLADLTAVYRNRAELAANLPADRILDRAQDVRAMGLSLNLLCQDYPDRRWTQLVEGGARIRCLFLDPDGAAIQSREREERFPTGQLSALTKLNIETLSRVRDRLPKNLQGSIEVATYDETLRFNVVLVDDLCLAQPYLPASRGVDSPTFVMRRGKTTAGLYAVFEQVFASQWERGQRR